MPSLAEQNLKKIREGFLSLEGSKDVFVASAMKAYLHDAIPYALAAHKGVHAGGRDLGKHPMHYILGDSYGWKLVHNGVVVGYEINEGKRKDKNVSIKAMLLAAPVPDQGWVGLIMAGMQPSSYFELQAEMTVLGKVRKWTDKSFGTYFKRVKV